MKKLFEPVVVGKVPLRNRIIRSATFEYAFDDAAGSSLSVLQPMYERLAEKGVAAIITGMVGVDENSRVLPSMVKAYGSRFVPELRQLAEVVHARGSKIIVQINHCGQKANQIDAGGPPLGPCATEAPQGKPVRGMSNDDIRSVVASFASTAARCKEAGADAAQIHATHGYLLSQFLNPHFNKREDEYGGAIENRARIVFEVYDAFRAAVGDGYPVWIKINSKDLTKESISADEFLWMCKELDKRGIDAIEVSAGASVDKESATTPVIKTEKEEGSFAREALRLAEEVSASVISVCGYRTPEVMEQ